MTPPPIRHVIVLMMENRSFDHMLGTLNHPNAAFEGLNKSPASMKWLPNIDAVIDGSGSISTDPGPDHGHLGVMQQLTGIKAARYDAPYTTPCDGFAQQYEEFAIIKNNTPKFGDRVVKCLPSSSSPVLATLALEFGVFDHWFSSVPGETWPNRNFAHAGTADGEVNIHPRLYTNTTIFEQLADGGATWGIFHDGPPQAWVFPKLWDLPWRNRFHGMKSLFEKIKDDKLPHYSFVEPKHFLKHSNSQHPGNNVNDTTDFDAGEELIRTIYNALVAKPDVFARTLLLITYDEHGGYFDHVAPPQDSTFKDGEINESGFAFDMLGVRVPAVIVSPFIKKGALDQRVFDHSSIVATLQDLFIPGVASLGRSGTANRFVDAGAQLNFWEINERQLQPLPVFNTSAVNVEAIGLSNAANTQDSSSTGTPAEEIRNLDEFQQSLLWLTDVVNRTIQQEQVTGRRAPVEAIAENVPESLTSSRDAAPDLVPEFVDSVMIRFRESVR